MVQVTVLPAILRLNLKFNSIGATGITLFGMPVRQQLKVSMRPNTHLGKYFRCTRLLYKKDCFAFTQKFRFRIYFILKESDRENLYPWPMVVVDVMTPSKQVISDVF